jgi:hypothetical protein
MFPVLVILISSCLHILKILRVIRMLPLLSEYYVNYVRVPILFSSAFIETYFFFVIFLVENFLHFVFSSLPSSALKFNLNISAPATKGNKGTNGSYVASR